VLLVKKNQDRNVVEKIKRIYRELRKISITLRRYKYIWVGARLGNNVTISKMSQLSYPQNIVIGDNTWIGHGAIISARESISIGKGCQIAPYCAIYDSDHVMPIDSGEPNICMTVTIGEYCWIGCHVVILKGVTIGNNVTVAAGSVVTKSFPDNAIIAGIPAKVIGENKPRK
jgi:maltose O-acetyltransferase